MLTVSSTPGKEMAFVLYRLTTVHVEWIIMLQSKNLEDSSSIMSFFTDFVIYLNTRDIIAVIINMTIFWFQPSASSICIMEIECYILRQYDKVLVLLQVRSNYLFFINQAEVVNLRGVIFLADLVGEYLGSFMNCCHLLNQATGTR